MTSDVKIERADALLEIGCEELPVAYIAPALLQMEKILLARLSAARLEHEGIQSEATPRRLVLMIKRLSKHQPNITKTVSGPKKVIAYKADGSLTPAGEGFLRKFKLSPQQVEIKDGRLWACLEEAGQSTLELLPEIFLSVIKGITFPKSMRWEASGARFARPVRWLVGWFDNTVVPFTFADVSAGKTTRLHPLNQSTKAEISDIQQYLDALIRGKVILSVAAREKEVKKLLNAEAKKCGGCLVEDEELLQMVTMMCECPGVLSGKISEKFMQMPREVVTTAMREHQRYFAVEDENGKLLPYFLAVHDNPVADTASIRPGCERVLSARLKDAEFFYQEDMKHSLEDLVPKLERVCWVKGLGTLLDKTRRLENLCSWLAQQLDPDAEKDAVAAAHLSKADLITHMIQEKEFTSLQGAMGTYYALAQGVPESTAQAIREQYQPRWADDALPQTPAGRILALADKIDHIIGCWGIGFAPTGTKDPYALRRAAQGIIAITLDAAYRYSLSAVLCQSVRKFEDFSSHAERIIQAVTDFIQGRLETELADRGIAPDLSQAVLGVWWDDITALVQKAEAIHKLRSETGFNESIITFSRVVNILPKETPRRVYPTEPDLPVQPGLMSENAEKSLFAAYQEVGQTIADLSEKGDFATSFQILGKLKSQVDRFFDEVLVMDKKEEVRENRLNLLTNLARKIWSLADFSKLVVAD